MSRHRQPALPPNLPPPPGFPAALPLAAALAALALACTGTDEPPPSSYVGLLVINEVVHANAAGCTDAAGDRPDWIELYNASDADVDLEKFSVSDDAAIPLKKVFGAGVVVEAHGFLLLWADDTPAGGETHLPFKLKASGEQVLLYDAAQALVDQFRWNGAADDTAFARFPDGTGAFAACATSTCGETNGAACAP